MTSAEPDMTFDATALFRHLIDDLGMEPEEENDWAFSFSHIDFGKLQEAMEPITEAFASEVDIDANEPAGSFDEAPICEDENGTRTTGPPQFTIEYSGTITEDTLKRLHKQFKSLTKKLGVNYLGVEVY